MGGMEGGEERFCPKEGREGEKTMRASRASLKSAASSALCATAPFTLTTTAVAAVARSTTLRRCSSLLPTHRSEFRARLGEFPKKRRRNVPDSLGRAALAAPSISPASATFVTRKPQRNQASPAVVGTGSASKENLKRMGRIPKYLLRLSSNASTLASIHEQRSCHLSQALHFGHSPESEECSFEM